MQAESLRTAQREQLAALQQQTELVRAFVDSLGKQQEVLKQQQPELTARWVRLLEAALCDQPERRTAAQQQQQADLVRALGETLDATLDKQHKHAAATQQQHLACIRELLEQQRKQHEEQQRQLEKQQRRHKEQQRRQESNWQLLLASSQRQEQLLLKLLERQDTAAPPAAALAPGQEQESAAASSHGDSVACGQPAVGNTGTGTAGTQEQQHTDKSVRPRLLDYVRVREEVRIPRSRGGKQWEDVIPAGAEGVVLASAGGGTRLKVRPYRRTAVRYVRVHSRIGVLLQGRAGVVHGGMGNVAAVRAT